MGLAGWASRYMRRGDLTITVQGRAPVRVGDGTGPAVRVRVTRAAAFAIALNPWLKAGEAYMEGALVMEAGSVHDLIAIIALNAQAGARRPSRSKAALAAALRFLSGLNGREAARRNVRHHYDLSADFYRLFLDADLQYSCAYVADPAGSADAAALESWQAAKKAHLAAKLRLRPGDRVLDIGCGWGGLALTLAQDWDARVTGITLSTEQLATARARAAERGLEPRARFELKDYRDVEGPFDRLVSVGMFEHVGTPNYQAYFDAVARLLTDDGVAVVHAIGRRGPPGMTNPWVARYVFPGGYIPSLSQVLPAIERSGLWVTDLEVLRLHYADTLAAWNARFQAARQEVAQMYDERFCRMWEFYLAISENAFRHEGYMVFQLQLSKRIDAVPVTRDYIAQTLTQTGAATEEARASPSRLAAAE